MVKDETEFDSITFIKDGTPQDLKNPVAFPFLYNNNGTGEQHSDVFGKLITIERDNPDLDLGNKYFNIKHSPKTITPDSGKSYEITLFDFGASEVHYTPLSANKENVQAFGMTLLKSGECVKFPYKGLITSDFTYGKWAGHQSPYLGPGRGRELLPINPTDLEYHNFPHVFFSRVGGPPLVISVARWRPYVNEIALADLWVKPGDAIVLPPKVKPVLPRCASDDLARSLILDLHGNRNSARACWLMEGNATLLTTTILGNKDTMMAAATKPHYHEEKSPTTHTQLQRFDL